ncbi:Xenotropic and polytropic retrovirus receptor 1 [Cryptotrichosporon argae]
MKFGRYLVENQTPEWKRAYIDYRACKKAIKAVAVRLGQRPDALDDADNDNDEDSDGDDDHGPSARPRNELAHARSRASSGRTPEMTGMSPAVTPGAGSMRPSPLRSPRHAPAHALPRLSDETASNLPPLDLGEPGLPTRESSQPGRPRGEHPTNEDGRGRPSSSTPTATPALASARRTGGRSNVNVNFSPVVQAFPNRPNAERPRSHSRGGMRSALSTPRMRPASPGEAGGSGSWHGHTGEAGSAAVPARADGAEPRPLHPADPDHSRRRSTTSVSDAEADAEAVASDSPLTSPPTPVRTPRIRAGYSPRDFGSRHKHSPHVGTSSPRLFGRQRSGTETSAPQPDAGSGVGADTVSKSTAGLSKMRSRGFASVGSDVARSPEARKSGRSFLPSPRPPRSGRTFEELYGTLEPDERAFFDLLDRELDKVEAFYHARETDAVRRAHELRGQLRELAEHRKIFHDIYDGVPEWEAKVGQILPGRAARLPALRAAERVLHLRTPWSSAEGGQDSDAGGPKANGAAPDGNGHASSDGANGNANGKGKNGSGSDRDDYERQRREYDPERYQKYKKELRSAVLEFYRHLELIKNYRILNLTGFRKALKKFEKATRIICLDLYTDDRIAPESFAHEDTINGLLKQMEDLFGEHFEHGDLKKARDKLRGQVRRNSHYQTIFRSGVMLGLAFPPAIIALVKAGEAETQRLLPAYAGLLQVYAALYLPVIFAILFELNLDAWVTARINYEFVMELSNPVLDFRSYLEIPAFLFLTLSYCFFFSFYRVAPNSVAPTTWPAAWLAFVCVFFLNPLPVLRRRSRYWFLRVLFRVCTPGYSRVEFIAFFLADELNSLVYTLQNIYFMSCAYAHDWPANIFGACPSGASWPYALLLCLPALCRLIQCVKRWHDSKLRIHLINAGKYLSSITQYICFVWWRSRGSLNGGAAFAIWIVAGFLAASYTSSWDLVVDWSLFRPGASGLRQDLGYGSKAFYYWAMVSNVLVRFIFIWYVPASTRHTRLRSFVFAVLEMLRRWQWNFFRVETEHLGNADAYRVTREIPLPYRRREFDASGSDDSDDALVRTRTRRSSRSARTNQSSRSHALSVRLDRIRSKVLGDAADVGGGSAGRGPDELNVGPRGHAAQREYEASRPGDLGSPGTDAGEV